MCSRFISRPRTSTGTCRPHFRDYHLLLDDHADQIVAMTDDIAERVSKIGGTTIRSIGHISRLQRIRDNDAEFVDPGDMLANSAKTKRDLWCATAAKLSLAFSYQKEWSIATALLNCG